MIKVFISQPMSGRTEEEIIEERLQEIGKIRMYFDEDVQIIDSYITDDDKALMAEDNANNKMWSDGNEYVYMLGLSITLMAQADVVWFVDGWANSRGCMYEWSVACDSGMRLIMKDSEGKIQDVQEGEYE